MDTTALVSSDQDALPLASTVQASTVQASTIPASTVHGSLVAGSPAAALPVPHLPGTRHPRVLSIAGSDPSGGAGIQADIKAISAHGGYAMAAITALTAQNTRGVREIHVPDVGFLRAQLEAISEDISIDAVKIGMLGTAEVMSAVGQWLAATRPPVVVLDPVMVATSGDTLMAPEARNAMLSLLSLAHLVTPNIPELGVLLGKPAASSWDEAVQQGKELAAEHQIRVLVKGGHLASRKCPDALVSADGTVHEFMGTRIDTPNTHGTGCSLSAALATLMPQLNDWPRSVARAKAWLARALETSAELAVGHGSGPVNHLSELWATAAPHADSFSQELWADCAEQRAAIASLDFISELAAGTLARRHFAYYLAQDALYLGTYSRVLARASALAPTEAEQKFWAGGAQNCLEVEVSLHRDWLSQYPLEREHDAAGLLEGGQGAGLMQGPVTKHYVDHLQGVAFSGSYGEVVAAVLPCYWLYAEVGRMLHTEYLAFEGEHPYGAWLQTYASEEFAKATETAIAILDNAARSGSVRERAGMKAAFAHSAAYEVDFFAAPHLHAPAPQDTQSD
ncbi:bifunctional hydroxymethylpyrimidine kinase/phosphomethylpyrimidine kinase [Arthrobacter psychrochitiniphilus]|uniref:Bifunctional hydroxymethylpyrimidine kinase/phosphomethylpyrimidine kinase n=1 Tax=Arthrobacter psychrochitiniphilus TaxID=291045 RepID=A0A2V3DQA5_9MICC|nr:bifunctional hydroxymethylpyrimidine kinase/phosphomethylpyrimidine kinase [Arthrobacter psychrochitiniphilus]NYG17793.1 hydroxymethylpyrimidine/phosphomethylpyrimidine kinase [Arthrobacter psychrochitiniphilus]PXA65163.1 bifunctional hydroxymethylpyrimidine kinase/phosphomethylpyrimidine kinase [Arthrobacter psychrochitiniphilus]